MSQSPETIRTNPYSKCIKCPHLGTKCDGPNVVAMSKEMYYSWCKDLKNFRGWSNAELAEISCVSKSTIDRVISGTAPGLNGETISAITCALIYGIACSDGSWGKYPCAMVAMEDVSADCPKCAELRRQLDYQTQNDQKKIDHLKQQISFDESQLISKDTQLQQRAVFIHRKDRFITALSIMLGIAVILIIGALVVDLFNPNIGFFWVEQMAALVG